MWYVVVTLTIGAQVYLYQLPHSFNYREDCKDRVEDILSHWALKSPRDSALFECRKGMRRV